MIGRRSHTRLDHEPCGVNCYMMNADVRRRLEAERAPDDSAEHHKETRDDVTTATAPGGGSNSHRGRKRKRVAMGVAAIAEPRGDVTALSSAASSCSEESDTDAGERAPHCRSVRPLVAKLRTLRSC